MTNVSGIAAEKFFNPEFKKVMESLREKDNTIRAIVSGKEIEGADPGSDPVSLKDLLKSAKSNLNRREYMTAVAELGRFHKKVFDVKLLIDTLEKDVDAVHHEFLFRDLGEEHKKQLADLKTRFATTRRQTMVKEASIMDFFYNIGTKRGRALAAWEKRYPKQVSKLKRDTVSLLSRSEAVLSMMLGALKEMASARATRNVDNYMKAADKITKNYQMYDKTFKDYYVSNIEGFLKRPDVLAPTSPVADAKELGKEEIPVEQKPEDKMQIPTAFGPSIKTNVTVPPESGATVPSPPPDMSVPPSSTPHSPTALAPGKIPTIPPAPAAPTGIPASGPATEPSPPPSMAPESGEEYSSDMLAKQMWGKASHKKFFASLEALAGESPLLLASHINKYARQIQGTDPETSIALFKISKSIRG